MLYFYCVDVKCNSEYFYTQDIDIRTSGAIECSRIENTEQFDSVFNELKNDLFTEHVKALRNSASIEDCTFSLTAFNPL